MRNTVDHHIKKSFKLFDDSTMIVAAIDRLVRHAMVLHCEGESYRRKVRVIKFGVDRPS